jgi:hypothetical protein
MAAIFNHLVRCWIDHVRLASFLWHGLCQDRRAAFGHAMPVRLFFGWRDF